MFSGNFRQLILGLLTLATIGAERAEAQQPAPPAAPQYAAILTVKHLCCAKESIPAIKELSRIPGIKRVAVDYKTRSLYIEQTDVVPSRQAIWDAAARIQIEPLRLATPEGVYNARPKR